MWRRGLCPRICMPSRCGWVGGWVGGWVNQTLHGWVFLPRGGDGRRLLLTKKEEQKESEREKTDRQTDRNLFPFPVPSRRQGRWVGWVFTVGAQKRRNKEREKQTQTSSLSLPDARIGGWVGGWVFYLEKGQRVFWTYAWGSQMLLL